MRSATRHKNGSGVPICTQEAYQISIEQGVESLMPLWVQNWAGYCGYEARN